ncbi:MAG TPA: DUF4398 domain-containing protein [Mariprofundaceae bacterium]|nr:DUF4398 domain-containing protein [Mariprofundaceae bacterium]
MTDFIKHRILGHMLRVAVLFSMSLWLVSCAAKPPVQAMAEARAAVQSVQPLYASEEAKQSKTYKHFQSAEQSLKEASEALAKKNYAQAKQKAKQAKYKARMAAKIKQ